MKTIKLMKKIALSMLLSVAFVAPQTMMGQESDFDENANYFQAIGVSLGSPGAEGRLRHSSQEKAIAALAHKLETDVKSVLKSYYRMDESDDGESLSGKSQGGSRQITNQIVREARTEQKVEYLPDGRMKVTTIARIYKSDLKKRVIDSLKSDKQKLNDAEAEDYFKQNGLD